VLRSAGRSVRALGRPARPHLRTLIPRSGESMFPMDDPARRHRE
jgi:hypothetical protein